MLGWLENCHEGYEGGYLALTLFDFFLFDLLALFCELVVKFFEHQQFNFPLCVFSSQCFASRLKLFVFGPSVNTSATEAGGIRQTCLIADAFC